MGSRKVRWIGSGVAVVLVLFGLWVAWQVWHVQRDLNDAIDHGKAIQRAVEDGDTEALDKELAELRESSQAASDRTDGITWSVLTKVPIWGDDASGVEVASRVLADLATDGVKPLATASDRFDDLLPQGGRIDTAQIESLAGPVAEAEAVFTAADKELAAVDSSVFMGRLEKQFNSFRDQIDKASGALDSAKVATDVLPAMLGADGPRHYVLVFQNNAEIRGTGGLAGAASYIEAADGKLTLKAHAAGSSLGEATNPVLPLTKAETALYGEQLGTYFVNAGMTPDVPRVADLIRARWEQEFPRQQVDGVLMVDAVAIAYLLEASGQVTIGGVTLTGDNVVDELLHKSYLRLPDPKDQDAFFAAVSAAAFKKFVDGAGESTSLLTALSKAADEHRLLVHSFDEEEQKALAGSAVSGDFVVDPKVNEPQITVTLNDNTGAKMSYFLRYEVNVSPTSCVDDVQTFTAKARLRSTAPRDAGKNLPDYITGAGEYGVPPGIQLVALRIFAPAGGKLGELNLNGAQMDLIRVEQDGRAVGATYIELKPGQTVDLSWTMESGAGQTGGAEVSVTPTIEKKDGAKALTSACASKGN